MTMLPSLSVCLLILFHLHARAYQPSQGQSQCQLQKIDALEPLVKKSSEAGDTEIWDENNEQFECAGVVVIRHTIQPKGLLLPHYHNAPKLTYIVQGRGMYGAALPGCPETYQSSSRQSEQQQSPHEQGQSQEQRYEEHGDKHQKVRLVRQGDIVATAVGILHWFYNDGQTPLVLVLILDTSNNENQLDDYPKTFYLGGNPQQQRQQGKQSYQQEFFAKNILGAFGDNMLSEAFGVMPETARKLKGENDDRGNIVRVENGLQVIKPTRMQEEEQEQEEQGRPNGLEESMCNAKLRINIDNPSQADVYNPQAGYINRINSRNLPILRTFKLNAERGKLYQNALMVPHWNLNAHSVIYVTRGSAQVQIVGNYQQPIFDGQLNKGQLLLVPQNFAVVKRASDQGFEWISFKTNDVATINAMAGMNSALRAMPEEVLMNAFRISREEARKLKYNREEDELFPPRSESQQRTIA